MTLGNKRRSSFCASRPRWLRAHLMTGWLAARPWRRGLQSLVQTVLVLGLATSLFGCKEKIDRAAVGQTCREWGLCDEESHPRRFALLCDTSLLAPCSAESLAQSLDVILPLAAREPSSPVEIWMLGGTSVGHTHSLGEKVSPTLPQTREKAREQAMDQWSVETRAYFLRAAETYFKAPQPRRSVLAESITKLAMAHPPDPHVPTELVIISDAREVSLPGGDLECELPPAPAVWTARLQRHGILGPGILTGTRVYWTYVSLGSEAPRCRASVKQEQAVRSAWQAALSSAGALRVSFLSGPAVFSDSRPTGALARKE